MKQQAWKLQNVAFNQFKDGRNKGWPLKSWGNPLQVDPTKLEKRGLLSCWKWMEMVWKGHVHSSRVSSCMFGMSGMFGMFGWGENSGNPKLLDPWLREKEDPKKQRQFRIQDGILIQIPTQLLCIYIYIYKSIWLYVYLNLAVMLRKRFHFSWWKLEFTTYLEQRWLEYMSSRTRKWCFTRCSITPINILWRFPKMGVPLNHHALDLPLVQKNVFKPGFGAQKMQTSRKSR